MARRLSADIRHLIVKASFERPVEEVAAQFYVSTRTVHRIIKQGINGLQFERKERALCISKKLKEHAIQYMIRLIQRNPCIYLGEIKEKLSSGLDIEVSKSTIYRTLV
ncbi:SubName: Full=Uncharacterized protein {ECO:0000313/EMBL:CCA74758.1} [Serendipita indica DSM 11827]|uniref:Transposase Synechocystis PCC 6803 domain-containing protein n=1 Tax=Serendipita indica (strain DSM 11827) TaxID=1109443 RepID=G4TTW5_SERID|nr:SubName: Full=Uncharacterized protein {ECO:0000313/EMBL:CCA74758.1} [Serendipita indica DSM 11827]CCA74758.1 hypothetical protein PIIN_08716 [Serendipita indica DSM 11827]